MKTITKLWIILAILVILTPLGLIIPDYFKAGSAWGEWSVDEIQKFVGYVPQGLAKLSELWKAPLPDYCFQGWEDKGSLPISLAYIISGALGVIIVAGIILGLGKLLVKEED